MTETDEFVCSLEHKTNRINKKGYYLKQKGVLFTYLLRGFAQSNMLGMVQTFSDTHGTTTKVTAANMSKVSPITNNISA